MIKKFTFNDLKTQDTSQTEDVEFTTSVPTQLPNAQELLEHLSVLEKFLSVYVNKNELEGVANLLLQHVESVKNDVYAYVKNDVAILSESFNLLSSKFKELNHNFEQNLSSSKKLVYDSLVSQDEKIKIVEELIGNIDKDNINDTLDQLTYAIESLPIEYIENFYKHVEKINEFKDTVDRFGELVEENNIKVLELEKSSNKVLYEARKVFNLEKYEEINRRLNFFEQVLNKFDEKITLNESLVVQPAIKTSDPLTPLNQNYVTFDDLKKHYQLFINRIQQQLMSIGGGGSYWLYDLGDTNYYLVKSPQNGQVLTYNSANVKWEPSYVSSSGGGNVFSVNGEVGHVVLTTSNIAENNNLYFTNNRVIAALTAGDFITIESNGRISSTAQNVTNITSITSNIAALNENVFLSNTVESFNFVGSGVSATNSGNSIIVTIPGSNAQLQSDWSQTDSSNVTFILNKPDLSNHGILSGLSDDDHPQYLHTDVSRTANANITFAGNISFTGPVAGLTSAVVTENTNLYYSNVRVQNYLGNVSGNLIPEGYGVYELGSLTNPWKDLWITGQSLKILSDGQIYTISVVSGTYVFSDGSGNVIFTANATNKPITNITANLLSNVDGFSTSNIIEGSNLYFTNTRAISSLTAGENLNISSNGLVTVSLPGTLTHGGRYEYTTNNNQIIFTGNDNYGNALTLFQNTTTEVFLNGIRLIPDVDYTSNSTHVVLSEPTSINENLSVIDFIPSSANSEYIKISDLKNALQTGSGDFNSFKAWVLTNL